MELEWWETGAECPEDEWMEEGFTPDEFHQAFLLLNKLGRMEFNIVTRGIENNKLDETCRGLLSELLALFELRPELRARMHEITLVG